MPRAATREISGETALSPARAALLTAIEELDGARARLEEAQNPLSALERVAAQSAEAAELRQKISWLRAAHDAKISDWVAGGAVGERPALPSELIEAEIRLAKLAEALPDGEHRLHSAAKDCSSAAQDAGIALAKRDEALWRATLEAADPEIQRFQEAIQDVLVIEARLHSLVLALREVGRQGKHQDGGPMHAAEKIEARIGEARRAPAVRVDLETGRSLIHRLRSDALAALT